MFGNKKEAEDTPSAQNIKISLEHILEALLFYTAKELSFKPSFESVDIVAGDLGENASAIGVALLSDTNDSE